MPYRGIESLNVDEPCIEKWLKDLNSRTALNYGNYFLRYRDWFRDQVYWSSAKDMIDDYESLVDSKEKYGHVDILKEYSKSKNTGSSDRRNTWYAVRSFYSFHRLPLPRIPRSESSRLFKPSKMDKRRSLELTPLMLDDVRRLIINSPQPYRTVLMVMFQSAMGLSEFSQFNLEGWRKVVDKLDPPGPLRVVLYREKTSRTRVSRYYTFIGKDGKMFIKEWLNMRPQSIEDALFVVFNKNRKLWVPVRGPLIGNMITKTAKKMGLIKPNGLNRYHVHAHEFRDLFKSLCTLNGVNSVASEFFLGHNIDKLGYDKSPEYDVEWFRREYSKVEPQLNLISGSENREDVKKEAALVAMRSFAEAFGIDPMRVRIEKQKEIGRDLNSEEEIQAIQNEIRKMREQDDPQIIVREEELENHLNDGWEFVSVLPSKRILIRK